MRVGKVKTRPGKPTIAPDRTAGATRDPVTAIAVRQRPAPRIWGDSSIDESTDSRALAARR